MLVLAKLSNKCENGYCTKYIHGKTCARCQQVPDNNQKCCDDDIKTDPKTGKCDCVEPPCQRNSQCYLHNLGPYRGIYVFDKCVNGVCVKPKSCRQCGEMANGGKCCSGRKPDGQGYCSCPCKTGLDCKDSGYSCENYFCVAEHAGKNCGVCGSFPINNKCCGEAIVDNVAGTGKCVCNIGTGCRGDNECVGNSYCCKGHCQPNSKMCS